MPRELDLPADVRKVDGRWLRDCPKCGNVVDHLRRNYCVNSSLLKQPCKACSNKTNNPAGMFGSVRVSWYNSFRKSAVSRGYDWEIDIEFIDALYDLQGGKCALTGLPIGWSVVHRDHTASIDRIDNELGYHPDNVQLVHKEINMLRGSLSIDRLIELSIMIAEKSRS